MNFIKLIDFSTFLGNEEIMRMKIPYTYERY